MFGDSRATKAMSATIINEYYMRDRLEETLIPHGMWGDDSD